MQYYPLLPVKGRGLSLWNFQYGSLSLDIERHTAFLGETMLDLYATEFQIMGLRKKLGGGISVQNGFS